MRYGIPLLGDRVAPRCTFADSVMTVVLRRNRVYTEEVTALCEHGLLDLTKVLADHKIDILICGGISRHEREFISARRVEVIDNVAGSRDELIDALGSGAVRPGFGLAETAGGPSERPVIRPDHSSGLSASESPRNAGSIDCLSCHNRACLVGEPCDAAEGLASAAAADADINRQLEASLDISSEDERTLCRLSELIYFCLEMRYQRIGVAYCVDLQEPTEILVRVLRRFFKVYPVCCKIGGIAATNPTLAPQEPGSHNRPSVIACNPVGQADALRRIGTDLNVLVGMCMGSDCIFTRLSDAPVTTLFVKDRSLANNPIGAIYSDYYLREAIQTSPLCHREESIE